MSSSTVYESKNHNSTYYTKKRDDISTNIYLRGDNGLQDGVDIYYMLPVSTPNQYVDMEYNNEHHNLQSNGNISTF